MYEQQAIQSLFQHETALYVCSPKSISYPCYKYDVKEIMWKINFPTGFKQYTYPVVLGPT